MTRLPVYILRTAVLCFFWLPAAGWSAEVLSLDAAVTAALAGNGRLAAAQAHTYALKEVPVRAGALPDPVLRLNAMNLPVDTFALSQEPMTQVQVGIGQMLPFPGKLALKSDYADYTAQAAGAEHDEVRQEVVRDVTSTWWRLIYLDRALKIVGKYLDLLRQFVTIARSKYSVGRGLQQDVLLAEVELSKLYDTRLKLQGEWDDTSARLRRLMGAGSAFMVTLPGQVDAQLPDVLPVPQLVDQAKQSRPRLAVAGHRVSATRSRLALAKKEHLPDLMVSAAYGLRRGSNANGSDRPDFATVMLSLNLPIDRKDRQDRLVAQRRHELDRQRYAEQAVTDRVFEQIDSAHARYGKARERVRLLESGIIPQAEQTVDSMRVGYQVNKVDFLNLIRAQITLFDYETRYWKLLAAAKSALAQLHAAVGEASILETGKGRQ